ncbi:MAG: lipopolysaccharide biosynthesis protein, partial [Bacteroidota bacterium]
MSLRKLASDTVIYGLSSILGRFINVLLVPLHTAVFSEAEYGVLSDIFALTALLMVVFTYRMEVAYFRHGADDTTGTEQK